MEGCWWLSVARTEATDETDMTQADPGCPGSQARKLAGLQADEGENQPRSVKGVVTVRPAEANHAATHAVARGPDPCLPHAPHAPHAASTRQSALSLALANHPSSRAAIACKSSVCVCVCHLAQLPTLR